VQAFLAHLSLTPQLSPASHLEPSNGAISVPHERKTLFSSPDGSVKFLGTGDAARGKSLLRIVHARFRLV
jgi:hypothetical protein